MLNNAGLIALLLLVAVPVVFLLLLGRALWRLGSKRK